MKAHILRQTTLSLRERNYPRPVSPDSRLALGFSLLEMMAVVAFILIVMTISTPIYHSAQVRTREAALRNDLFTLRSMIDRFTLDNRRAPASLQELLEKGYMGSLPRDPFTGSAETWQVELESASDSPDDSAPLGIMNVHCGSVEVSLEGTPYSSW
jgi:general secretion pathway protein G